MFEPANDPFFNLSHVSKVDQQGNMIDVAVKIYLIVSLLLLFRMIWNSWLIVSTYSKSVKTKQERFTIVGLKQGGKTHSFFNLIFIDGKDQTDEDIDQMIAHEKIHAQQHHSIDIILVELLTAVMWFNPFCWLVRKEIKLVHEFLADKGVIDTGINKLRYEALLINQTAGESLINFASHFSSSTIKKRIIMLNTSKKEQSKRFKKWVIVAVGILLFMGVAIVNGQNSPNEDVDQLNDQFVVVIDAGHGGIDPGAKAGSNNLEKEVNLSIYKKLKEKVDPNIQIIGTREDDLFVSLNDRVNKTKEVQADLFISIHVNSSEENHTKEGINCYIPKTSPFNIQCNNFSWALINELKHIEGIKIADAPQQADFLVLRNSTCPALLLTLGYITNENDLMFINNNENQELLCDKIIDAIDKARLK
jgi:N-acetylmuramoyl-L-alanine amidase